MHRPKKLQRITRRLVLRQIRLKDYSAWRTAHSTSKSPRNPWDLVNRSSRTLSKQHFRKSLTKQVQGIKTDSYYCFYIFLKDGTLIGLAQLFQVSRGISQNAELGYRLFNPFWGRGYAQEALKAVLDIGFRDLKLHRIEALVEPRNRNSTTLVKRLKFRKEGVAKRRLFIREKWVDLAIFVLTTEDAGYPFIGKAKKP